jgi:GT2 family glycosyltransferase
LARVSVIIPCYRSHETIPECLASLRAQTFRDFEVVLCDSSPDPEPARRAAAEFPEARLLHSPSRLLPHAARNRGAAKASGSILVFTDPDCAADPRWLELLVAAHEQNHPVVGGSVAGLRDWRNRAIHIVKYGWWLPGGRPGSRPQLPSANMSVYRELWDRVGCFREDRWSADTELSWRLRVAGATLRFEPAAKITHLDHGPLGRFLAQHRLRGLDFGIMRAETNRWGLAHRAARALGSPLVPFLMALRTGRRAAAAGASLDWIVTLPFQLAALAAWALGEAGGLLSRGRGT